MFFLQFFIWGAWLVTLGAYMMNTLNFTGAQVGLVYGAKGIACILMPSIVGIIADRWVKANILYACCHLLGAVALLIAANVSDPNLMFLSCYLMPWSICRRLRYPILFPMFVWRKQGWIRLKISPSTCFWHYRFYFCYVGH